ncbi:MAG: nitrite reductase small subunit NirD [Gammaproteobacteria bacterium]|nr:nitrite reductase small subunit NirD [Gammaproteobacteria bacterium]NIR82354.1 nitrite reductase small subunit NirD [Gammaproteobacteria bacterium]NIR91949.1 nitrite reductase small subunit NirD [Gammaproteobacteria bacterium]NIV76977.1 nitrite reductase small subunit NirD [Gammaproteobacteria bacterium]
MAHWIELGKLSDIPRLGSRIVSTAHGDIAVFRTAEDRVYALRDRCPHRGGPLSQGIVFGEHVACPLHDWVVGLADGCAQAPDEGCTPSYPVRVENGFVYLGLDERVRGGVTILTGTGTRR